MDNQLYLFIEKVFLHVIDISIAASYLIAAVLAVRFFLRTAPKNIRLILWFFVGVRLVWPFSIESAFSLIPEREHIDVSTMHTPQAHIDTGILVINQAIGQYFRQNQQQAVTNHTDAAGISVCAVVWFAGLLAVFGYFLFSWRALKRKVRDAVPEEIQLNNTSVKIYRSSRIAFPFLFGLFQPRIYLPFTVSAEAAVYVAAHELAHKRRKDYLAKLIGYLLLACYWFHPLVWVSYILMCRDLEFACDEQVIQDLGTGCKKEYSQALLACAIDNACHAACPIAFGEIGVKDRVKNILKYKKPAFWATVAAIVVCIAVGVCFMTQRSKSVVEQDAVAMYDTAENTNEKDYAVMRRTLTESAGSVGESTEAVAEDTISDKYENTEAFGAAGIRAFFPSPHDEQENLYMEADLDGDGHGEKIVMTDLHYNGGDGGYKLEVFRVENGKEVLIPLPYGQTEDQDEDVGFPIHITYTSKQVRLGLPSGMQIIIPEEQVQEIYREKGDEDQLNKITKDNTYQEEWAADAVSGFTVVKEAGSDTPVLVTKQYVSGYLGHADCFGYVAAYLKLQPDHNWEVEYDFLRDE